MITRGKATIAKMLVRPKVGIGMSQKVGIGGMSVLPKKLPSRLPKTTQRKDMGKNGEKRSDKSKHIIVALIKRFPKIRQTEMAKATGLTVKGVEKVLAQLKAANVIVRVGGKRFGQWQVCKQEPNA